jgi:hypothetical protein
VSIAGPERAGNGREPERGFWRQLLRRMIRNMGFPADRAAVRRSIDAGLLCALVLGAAGCTAPERRADFGSINPSERSAAAAKAAAERDESALPDLIVMLDSSDPASRMVAIAALERITGQRLGYDATADRADRNAAADRWVRYAIENGYAEDRPHARGGLDDE